MESAVALSNIYSLKSVFSIVVISLYNKVNAIRCSPYYYLIVYLIPLWEHLISMHALYPTLTVMPCLCACTVHHGLLGRRAAGHRGRAARCWRITSADTPCWCGDIPSRKGLGNYHSIADGRYC